MSEEPTVPEEPKIETPKAEQPLPQPEVDSKIKEAREVMEAQKKENDRTEALIMQQRALRVEDALGGKSTVEQKETQEDKDKKAARALLPEGIHCPGVTD